MLVNSKVAVGECPAVMDDGRRRYEQDVHPPVQRPFLLLLFFWANKRKVDLKNKSL